MVAVPGLSAYRIAVPWRLWSQNIVLFQSPRNWRATTVTHHEEEIHSTRQEIHAARDRGKSKLRVGESMLRVGKSMLRKLEVLSYCITDLGAGNQSVRPIPTLKCQNAVV